MNEMSLFSRGILLATDGCEESELAARVAVELAKSTGAELHLVHVKLPPITPPYPEVLDWRDDLESADREARELLHEQAKKAEEAGGAVAGVHLREAEPAEEIIALAEKLGVALIVVGSRNQRWIWRALRKSVSDRVVCHAHCPVLVVRAGARVADGAREVVLTGSPGNALSTESLRNHYRRRQAPDTGEGQSQEKIRRVHDTKGW